MLLDPSLQSVFASRLENYFSVRLASNCLGHAVDSVDTTVRAAIVDLVAHLPCVANIFDVFQKAFVTSVFADLGAIGVSDLSIIVDLEGAVLDAAIFLS
jgi:hypothetical protein